MDLCNRNDIQALLQRHGFHFSKAMGQNFLIPWSWTGGCGRCWRRPWPGAKISPWCRGT